MQTCGEQSHGSQWSAIQMLLSPARAQHINTCTLIRKWRERMAIFGSYSRTISVGFSRTLDGLLTTAECFRGSLEQKWQQTQKSKYLQT